jgi:hypothetical protein
MLTEDVVSARARALAGALEPVAGQVYFAPECHRRYEAEGFDPSPGTWKGAATPEGCAYFCSRGSAMGQVPGEVVAAAFGVFNPAVVVPMVERGWTISNAARLDELRTAGSIEHLRRILGDDPPGLGRVRELLTRATSGLRVDGRPLYAGLVARGLPDDPVGPVWRLADQLREYRGDSHISAWTAAGFDAVEIGLLSELYWGVRPRSYIRSRAWSNEELDAASERLEARGLTTGGAFTADGRAAREQVELDTDRQCRPIVDALGDDHAELVSQLTAWSRAILDAHGYPGAGPHLMAEEARRAG